MGSTWVEEGRCICGHLLTGQLVFVMPCCLRRIHLPCLQQWKEKIEEIQSKRDEKGVTIQTSANLARHCCDCGAKVLPYHASLSVHARVKEWQAWVERMIKWIGVHDLVEVSRMYLGPFDHDPNLTRDEIPRTTDMGWKNVGPRFWLRSG